MSDNDDYEKYIGFVEADAGLTVKAKDADEAREKLEQVNTGYLGPPKVRTVELFDKPEGDDGD